MSASATSAAALCPFNALSTADAERALLACCGSPAWAARVAGARPFASIRALAAAADDAWWSLDRAEWLTAFRAHPKIGESAARPRSEAASRWSEGEQAGVHDANARVRDELAQANTEYESRFGHIFIVCATGLTASEMLTMLRARLGNAPDEELRVAAEEQRKITALRLEKMLSDVAAGGA